MSQSRTTPRSASVAPLYAAQPHRTPARRRAGALLMGTALSAVIGLGYGRGAYAQSVSPSGALSQSNNATVDITGPGTFETSDGFSVDAVSGDGITITTANTETEDTAFIDRNLSSIGGALKGIDANNYGTGALSITTTGAVSVPNTGFTGIYAFNEGANLTITSNSISAGADGILAQNYGNGDVSVDTYAEITAGDDGIQINSTAGLVTALSRSNINAGEDGIEVVSSGSGGASITALGNVTATNEGIYADNSNGNVTITADAQVSGGTKGVAVYNSGTDLTITANNVTGATTGIYADNDGSGALSITTTGTVTGTAEDGIYANNSAAGTDLTILANNVTGGNNGIRAKNYGTGSLSITANGAVTGSGTDNGEGGIRAFNYSSSTGDLTVFANDVTGVRNGINADQEGVGALNITVVGQVSSNEVGIDASRSTTGDITVETTGVINAGLHGIYTYDSAEDDPGEGPGDDNPVVNINAQERIYATYGTKSYSFSEADINVTAQETIEADRYGIWVKKYNTLGNVTVTTNDVDGGWYGILVYNDSNEAINISVNGAVTGGTDDGIYARNASSTEDLTITIAEGGSVSTSGTDANDWAIEAIANNGAVIVNNFGTVTGRVNLTNSNTFTNAGTWDLAGTTSDFNATGNSLVVNEGLIIAASDGAADEISAIDNLDTFRSNAGGTIRLTDGNAGDLLLINGDGSTGAVGGGAGTFVTNGGTIELDVDLSRNDRRDFVGINGNLRLGDAPTALSITPVGATSAAEATDSVQIVRVGTGNGETSDAGAFVLAGPVEVGAIAYDLSLGDCTDQADENWYLCNNGAIGTTGAVFEAMPGVVLNSFARAETLQQRLGARVQGGTGPTLSTQGDADLPVAQSVGPWMRTWGDFADITPDNSTAGTSWEADSWGLEAGIGTILGDHAGGNLVGGVNLRYGATYADLSNPVGTGSINAEGVGLAATLTWFGNDGVYVDGTAAVDFVSIDARSQGGGLLLDGHDDVVYSASLEVGQRIALEGDTTIVPQAQLSWGRMRDGAVTDNLGNVVRFADRETATSRIGLTVEQDVTGTALGSGAIFAFGNVLHDLSGSRRVSVAGTNLSQSGAGDWFELGGGVSLQPSETTSLFGQVSYRKAFDGVSGDAVALSAGLRMEW